MAELQILELCLGKSLDGKDRFETADNVRAAKSKLNNEINSCKDAELLSQIDEKYFNKSDLFVHLEDLIDGL